MKKKLIIFTTILLSHAALADDPAMRSCAVVGDLIASDVSAKYNHTGMTIVSEHAMPQQSNELGSLVDLFHTMHCSPADLRDKIARGAASNIHMVRK